MEFIPDIFWLPVVFILGVVIGSFLNVVAYRLHTGKSLNDRSHCLSCGHTLSWYELFPLLSYVVLQGRCRICSAWIPSRYFLVELITGFSFLMVWHHTTDLIAVSLLLVFLSVLIVGGIYDLYHMIIPNEIVVTTALLSLVLVGYKAFITGNVNIILLAIAGGFIAFIFYGSLWWFSKGRWLGFGDAKLAFSLGVLVSLAGVFSLIVLSFWIGAIVSLAIMTFQFMKSRGQKHLRFLDGPIKMNSEIPFAPFLIGAFVLVFFFDIDVLSLTSYAITLIYNAF